MFVKKFDYDMLKEKNSCLANENIRLRELLANLESGNLEHRLGNHCYGCVYAIRNKLNNIVACKKSVVCKDFKEV